MKKMNFTNSMNIILQLQKKTDDSKTGIDIRGFIKNIRTKWIIRKVLMF
jgi:hypothetical protein